MDALVECVPNFSEGRNGATIEALVGVIGSVPDVHLLDVHTDRDHNRSVFTFVGPPDAVATAAEHAVAVAVARIDLRDHRGEHPRMGAADVVPFAPLDGSTLDDCVRLARRVGRHVGEVLGVPVYLYGAAATRPHHRWLPAVRRGGFEELRDAATDPAARPDFGPPGLHPTAGATAVGARPIIVAFNVLLATDDVATARALAREIRTSSGGLPAVQARGFLVSGHAQVSLNLLDVDVTPPLVAVEAISAGAARRGTSIRSSELVGMMPERCLPPDGAGALHLPEPVQLLEPRVRQLRSAQRG